MGITAASAGYLMLEAKARPYSGRVLTLGVQKVFMTPAVLAATAKKLGFELQATPPALDDGDISDVQFFQSIGFDEVVRTDYSDYEDADVLFDLNSAECPDELRNRFDLVVDGGTVEHVFHLPNALNNIFQFLKVGGRIIHLSPTSNFVDHGFYSFSPTLFWDFYAANSFEINDCKLFRSTRSHDTDPWVFGDYQPGCLNRVSFGGLGGGLYGVAVSATKTDQSTGDKIPQQSNFVAMWSGEKSNEKTKGKKAPKLLRRIRRVWRRAAHRLLLSLPGSISLRVTALSRFPLKVSGRF